MTARAQRIIASLNAPAPAIRYEIDREQITEKYRARFVQLEYPSLSLTFQTLTVLLFSQFNELDDI
jgi:hypothetical protein